MCAQQNLNVMKLRYKIIILAGALIILFRLLLPLGIRYSINKHLEQDMKSYTGNIEGFGLSLYKGSFHIEGLRVWKKDRADYDPLLSVDKMEVSLLSHLLLQQKKIMGSLEVSRAKINLIDSVLKGNQQFGEDYDWRQSFAKLVPWDLESVKITDSNLLFVNRDYKKPVQISVDNIFISAINIHNTENVQRRFPSQLLFSGRVQRDGWVRGSAQFDISKELPSLNAKVELTSLHLSKLNNAFILYGPYYFLNGELNMYSQVFMKDGNLRGYLTPFFKNVEAVKIEWNNRISKSYLSESVQSLGDLVLNSSSKKAHGRRYTFSGQMISGQEPWSSFWSSIRNGFAKPTPKRPMALRKKKGVIAEKGKEPVTTLR